MARGIPQRYGHHGQDEGKAMKVYLQAGVFLLVIVFCVVLWSIKIEYGL